MASSLPGHIAQKIYPNILSYLAKQLTKGCLAVTGTNGKSTTSGLLASILNEADYKIIHNRQGANLIPGIITAFVKKTRWNASLEADYALLEVDEAALPLLAKAIKCQNIIVTNLYRDQLDRYGELDKTAKLIKQGINEQQSDVILNADDPNVSNLSCSGRQTFFGLNYKIENLNSEIAYCPNCEGDIFYTNDEKSLNIWQCKNCGYKRPEPNFFSDQISILPDSTKFSIHTKIDAKINSLNIDLLLPGIFNIYNATAAYAAAFILGIDPVVIKKGLENYQTLFGRSEKILISDKTVTIQLIKNPAGASQSLVSLKNSNCFSALIVINDNFADGRDISWLWDANFECIANLNIFFFVSGRRAQDMAVRLKYAGVASDKITCIPSLKLAFKVCLEKTPANHNLWILPTYTALLEMQQILKQYRRKSSQN